MKFDLDRYAPMGFPLLQELKIFAWFFGISVLYSFGFLFRYLDAREKLFEFTLAGKKVLIAGAIMPEMSDLIGNAFHGFFLIPLLAIAEILYHYLFHKQGSKSIYLMKRLPNPWEFPKRCLTFPLLAILLSIIAALILYLLYYCIYICFTPKACLPTAGLTILRSVLL